MVSFIRFFPELRISCKCSDSFFVRLLSSIKFSKWSVWRRTSRLPGLGNSANLYKKRIHCVCCQEFVYSRGRTFRVVHLGPHT